MAFIDKMKNYLHNYVSIYIWMSSMVRVCRGRSAIHAAGRDLRPMRSVTEWTA